jgi:hypothetical protein
MSLPLASPSPFQEGFGGASFHVLPPPSVPSLLERHLTRLRAKALLKKDYERIAANRAHFGDFDPFGDFDLLFGGNNLHLKIADIPIRYRDRTYGETNINRWSHGLLPFWMLLLAVMKIKLI